MAACNWRALTSSLQAFSQHCKHLMQTQSHYLPACLLVGGRGRLEPLVKGRSGFPTPLAISVRSVAYLPALQVGGSGHLSLPAGCAPDPVQCAEDCARGGSLLCQPEWLPHVVDLPAQPGRGGAGQGELVACLHAGPPEPAPGWVCAQGLCQPAQLLCYEGSACISLKEVALDMVTLSCSGRLRPQTSCGGNCLCSLWEVVLDRASRL